MLADKLNLVKKNIEEACDTAGRSPQEVTLIAVSKTKPVEMLKEAYDAVSLLKLLLACQRCTQQLVKIVVSAAAAALIHHTEHRVHI